MKVGAVLLLVAVRDSAKDCFSPPFCTGSKGEAIRGFTDQANSKDSQICNHPQDFELYALGVYDESDASFGLDDKPQLLVRAIDVKIPEGSAKFN